MAQVTVEAKYIADTAQYVRSLRTAAAATNALADSIPGQVAAQNQLNKSVQDLGASAEQSSKGFSILRNAMGTAIGVQAVNMLNNVVGRFKAFAMASFDAAARVEELDIAMQSIGKATGIGTEAIQEATQAIRDNGIELGAAQQIAIEFAQNQLDLASASKVARVAQDLAVIAGKNSTQTTQILTRAIITGNSLLLKSAGISRQVSEAYTEYSAELGKTTRQLTAQERQQAVTNLILEEGEKVAGTYTGAMNAAGKVLRSFKRIINDIQIEIGKVLLKAFGPLIKATYDLLKAISLSMREGGAFSDTLSMLADSFQQITEPLVGFIKNLAASIKTGEGLQGMAARVEQLVPVFMMLVDAAMLLGTVTTQFLLPAFRALAPIFELVNRVLNPLLNLIARMPEPLRALVGAFILMRVAMVKVGIAGKILGASFVQLQTVFVLGFVKIANAITMFELRMKTARATSVGAMATIRMASKLMMTGVVVAFKSIGKAAMGLMASLGPVGWAILAVSAAMAIFMGRSSATDARVEALKDTVDETTGAFTDLTKATMMKDLRDMLSPEDQQMLRDMGIGVEAMAEAMMQGGPAVDNLRSKMDALASATGGDAGNTIDIARRNLQGYAKDLGVVAAEAEQKAADQAAAAQREVAAAQEAGRATMAAERNKQAEQARTLAAMSVTERATHDAQQAYDQFARNQARAMSDLETATVGAVNAMSTAFEGLKGAISLEANMDSAHDALMRMREQLDGSKKGIDGFSKGAKDNRKAIREYASEMMSWAESMDDPRQAMEVLKGTEAEVRESLEAKGIDPESSAIYQEVKGGIDAAQEAIDDMGDAVDKAKDSGISVTQALVEGIVTSIDDNANTLDAAGAAAADPLVEGLMNELEISSPSQVAIDAGTEFVNGLVIGITRGGDRVAGAMRSMVRAGINAAMDEAGISSPSKVTEWLGEMHDEGLAKGIEENEDKPIAAAERVARKVVAGFSKGLSSLKFVVGGGSFMDQLRDAVGSLPSLPTPLEQALGKEGAEKWLEKHEKELIAVQRAFGEIDQIVDSVRVAGAAIGEIRGALTGTTGTYNGETISDDSALIKAIGSEGDLSSALDMLDTLGSAAATAYDSLIAQADKATRKRLRGAKNATAGYVEAMRDEIAGYMLRRQQIAKELSALESSYSANVSDINSHYDDLEESARNNIKSIEDKWAGIIPGLEAALKRANEAFDKENKVLEDLIKKRDSFLERISSGFKKFANDLRVDGADAASQIVRTSRTLANGLTVITEETVETPGSAGSFAAALEKRLASVREFTANIRTLLARGLDPSFVQELVSQGVTGAADTVSALVAGSDSEISAINSAQSALAAEIEEFQQTASAEWYDAGVAQQEAVVAPLRSAAAAAQSALDAANATRDAELTAARNHLQQLKDDRDSALKAEYDAYVAQKGVLETEQQEIADALESRAQDIQTYFTDLIDPVTGLPAETWRLGWEAINGLIRGLRAREPRLKRVARDIGNAVRAELEAALRIASPSRVTKSIGEQIADGLILGMQSSERAVRAAAGSLADQVVIPVSAPDFSGLGAAPSNSFGVGGSATPVMNNYNVTVNAGMGADGAEVGRQVVEAIRKYERRSGKVFAGA